MSNLKQRTGKLVETVAAHGSVCGVCRRSDFRFCLWVIGEVAYVVGFSKRRLYLHKSKIGVTSFLGFMDLGYDSEPWWLCDAMESRSKPVTSICDFRWWCVHENFLC